MYSDAERQIFGPHSDGERQRFWDPLRVHRRLTQALQGEPNEWISRANDPADYDARDGLLRAARWAFELRDFDLTTGAGPTEADVESLLRSYLECMEGFSSRGPSGPTSSSPTVPPSSRPDDRPIPPTSASS